MRWSARVRFVLAPRRATAAVVPDHGSPPPGRAGRRGHGSVFLRHVDAGSCNGCELEIAAAFGPVYDTERFGVRLVAAPRHADGVVVTGPVTKNMAGPLAGAIDALAHPRVVVALGDCAVDCGAFAGAYGIEGSVVDVAGADLVIPGCPPHPAAIRDALRGLAGR